MLLAVTAVWGWTFVVVKDALVSFPPVPFLFIRFAMSFVLLGLAVRRVPPRRVLVPGACIGVALAGGYLAQTLGLQTTSPGTAGLLTGLFVVFTPLLERAVGRRVPRRTVVAVVVALAGTALLTNSGSERIGAGDLLEVAGAVCFAAQIVMVSRWSPGRSAVSLTLVQMGVCVIVFGLGSPPTATAPGGRVLAAAAITGVLAGALGVLAQTWAQARIAASRAALIYTAEPAWAVLFSVLLYGQRLAATQALGAALVLLAIAGHEVAGVWRAAAGAAP